MPRWNLLVVGVVSALAAVWTVYLWTLIPAVYESLNAELPIQDAIYHWGLTVLFGTLAILMWWFWWITRTEAGRAQHMSNARTFMIATIVVMLFVGLGLVTFGTILPTYGLLGNF